MEEKRFKAEKATVSSVSKRHFKGHVYNVTTETGNLFVEGILVHNSGGLGTPPHLRVECIAADSFVLLGNNDVVKAKDLLGLVSVDSVEQIGDSFVYHVSGLTLAGSDGFKIKEAPLHRIIERNFEGNIFRIRTRFGEQIEVTPNHPVAVFTSSGTEFVPAEKLSGKEFLLKPKNLALNTYCPALPVFNRSKSPNAIHLSLKQIDPDLCYWLGGMIAEGDFTSFQYGNSNRYLCEEMSACFERASGFRAGVYRNNRGYFFTSFNRKEVIEFSALLGLNGKTAKLKEIPPGFMALPKNISAHLLAALFDGDGSITKEGEICFATVSEKLALQVKNLLLCFGIQTSLSKRKQNWHSNKESWIFRVRTMDRNAIEIFFNEIPLKRKELRENCAAYLDKTAFSKTANRRVVPLLMPLFESIRENFFMIQDEVLPKRVLKSYSKSDISFEKLAEIVATFENRVSELKYLSLEAASADWATLRKIAKKLHLGTRKVRVLSGRDFRWGYRTNAGTLPFFRSFFSNLCENSANAATKELELLQKTSAGNTGFDQIVSIEKIPYAGKVYDLTTETGNFFAQGLLVQNCGMIHRASGGVLFLDEIATLTQKGQQELLTAMQEKKYGITGQSELSSGAMTKTEPVPCDFVLVASGNYEDLKRVHPALRSRIRGYGYEVYMNLDMPDDEKNRERLVQFVAQEVAKDGKIPHFSMQAVEEIIFEARRRAERKHRLTLKLRDLGGLIRAAGDIAKEKGHVMVRPEDVTEAKFSARTLEQQMVDKFLDLKKEYEVYLTEGNVIGRVNGLAVSSDGSAGMVLPIEAEMAPASSRSEGRIIATGKLGEIAKEAVQNVSALIKKVSGKDVSRHDLHIQFLQTYEGVEGDSASISVATAVISAAEQIPIKQSLAMTGSLSVRGEVLPVGGISSKIQAAVKAGFKEVIIPKANVPDIVLPDSELKKIKVIPVRTMNDVLANAFVSGLSTTRLLSSLKKILSFLPSASKEGIAKKAVS